MCIFTSLKIDFQKMYINCVRTSLQLRDTVSRFYTVAQLFRGKRYLQSSPLLPSSGNELTFPITRDSWHEVTQVVVYVCIYMLRKFITFTRVCKKKKKIKFFYFRSILHPLEDPKFGNIVIQKSPK